MTNTHHKKTTNESQLIPEIAFTLSYNRWRPLSHCLKYGFRKQ